MDTETGRLQSMRSKSSDTVSNEGVYLSIIKAIQRSQSTDIILNGEKLTAFPLTPGTRQGCPSLYYYSIQFWRSSGYTAIRGKSRKNQIEKQEAKLSLFEDNIILCTQKPKDIIRKLLRIKSVIVAKSRIQNQYTKSVAFLYLTMKTQKEKLKINSIYHCKKKNNYKEDLKVMESEPANIHLNKGQRKQQQCVLQLHTTLYLYT